MLTISRTLIGLVGLMGLSLAQAALPEHYPDSYAYGGTIDLIDMNAPAIIVNDRYMPLDPNVRVHTLRSRNQYLGSLQVGQAVGVHFGDSRSNTPVVSEIWVLPDVKSLLPPPPDSR